MKPFFAIAALLVSLACQATPSDARDAQAKAAFERVAAGRHFHIDATSFGDLDGDGIEDFATFLGDPHYNDNGVEDLQVLGAAGRVRLREVHERLARLVMRLRRPRPATRAAARQLNWPI